MFALLFYLDKWFIKNPVVLLTDKIGVSCAEKGEIDEKTTQTSSSS